MSEWQPIETVPKDRTKVLVGCFKQGAERYGLVAVDWYRTRENSDANYVGFGCFNDRYFPATHWMPLPPPPAIAASKDTRADLDQGKGD
jgi:hypothetical protein